MRICVLTSSYPLWPGHFPGHFVKEVCRQLTASGHKVVVVAPGAHNAVAYKVEDGIEVIRFSYFPFPQLQCLAYGGGMIPNINSNPLASLQIPFFMFSFIRQAVKISRNCDIVHAHWSINALPGLFCRKRFNIPVVASIRGSDFSRMSGPLVNTITRMLLRKIDGVITENEILLEKACQTGIPRDRIIALRNGVDLNTFKPGRNRIVLKGTPAEAAERVILFAGRLTRVKGPDIAIIAFEKILVNHPDTFLLVAGSGDMKEKLLRYVGKSEALKARVLFVGEIENNKMSHYYNASDLLIISSRSEGTPNVLLESMACGVPALSTPVGGVPQTIQNNKTGFIAENESAEALSKKLEALLKHPEQLKKAGMAARFWAEKNLNWRMIAARYVDFYKDVARTFYS